MQLLCFRHELLLEFLEEELVPEASGSTLSMVKNPEVLPPAHPEEDGVWSIVVEARLKIKTSPELESPEPEPVPLKATARFAAISLTVVSSVLSIK